MKKQKLQYSDISTVCLELAMFLHAGADAGSALVLLAEETEDCDIKRSLLNAAAQIDAGASLSAAIRDSALFPDDVADMLSVAETTGRTEEALRSLSLYYDRMDTMDRRFRSSLLYPSVLMAVMLSVIVVLLTKVLPILNDVYSTLGSSMTGIGGGLLRLGAMLDKALPVLLILLGVFAVMIIVFACSQGFRAHLSSNSRGSTRVLSEKARFAEALYMSLASGLDASESVEMASRILSDSAAAQGQIAKCKSLIQDGKSLSEALKGSELLPAAECRLLSLGFASGSGEDAAYEVARRLEKDAEEALEKRLGSIEPAMVIISSLLVGFILFSVMLPLIHIMNSIG